jgi:hypothetical protein
MSLGWHISLGPGFLKVFQELKQDFRMAPVSMAGLIASISGAGARVQDGAGVNSQAHCQVRSWRKISGWLRSPGPGSL